jgi:hypothetical protein
MFEDVSSACRPRDFTELSATAITDESFDHHMVGAVVISEGHSHGIYEYNSDRS